VTLNTEFVGKQGIFPVELAGKTRNPGMKAGARNAAA
jgi:hypothetical protein